MADSSIAFYMLNNWTVKRKRAALLIGKYLGMCYLGGVIDW